MAACLYDIAFIICFPLTQLYDHVQSVEVVLYNTGKVGLDFCALGGTDSQELAPGHPTISPTMVTEHGATPFPLTFSPSPPPPHLLRLTPSPHPLPRTSSPSPPTPHLLSPLLLSPHLLPGPSPSTGEPETHYSLPPRSSSRIQENSPGTCTQCVDSLLAWQLNIPLSSMVSSSQATRLMLELSTAP